MSSCNCCFLTCIQISQEAGQVVWYSHLFKNFPEFVVIHTVKGFGIVNEAEVDVFLELSCFLIVNRVQNAVLGCNLKNNRIISVHFQGKPFSITEIQVYAPTNNAEEAEMEQFCEDLLELTPQKDVLFIIGIWNAKVGSQEIPGVTGRFSLGVQNEAGQRIIEFFQENSLVIANTLFQQHKRRLYTWTSPDGQFCNQRW